MLSKNILIGFLLVLSSFQVNAQVVQGTIVNEAQEPLENVHVQVKDTDIAAVSDEDGLFHLNASRFEMDVFTLVISRVGYETASLEIDPSQINKDSFRIELKEAVYKSETMVVTATRTRRDLEEVSIPVTVVSNEEIRSSGNMRLSDVLSEQTGMQIVNDHGTGIQVQGFDPDYTLVMIDGNPVIGRTAGTLDLNRVTVRNVEQIEIVKGPSSALWGNDALAGVINIITQQNNSAMSGGLTTRYGENNTLDLTGNFSYNTESWENDVSLNRHSSTGYKLNAESVSRTVPEFENYTFTYRTALTLNDRLDFETNLRYFDERQENLSSVSEQNDDVDILNSEVSQQDFLVRPSINYTPADRLEIDLRWMISFYKTDSEVRFRDSNELYSKSYFRQYYNKPELLASYRWSSRHHSILGGGTIFEGLDAERYPGQPDFTTRFAFAQHTWTPLQRFEVTGGLRYDAHSEYSSQLSPKLSSRFEAADWVQFRASVGRGFKAPEFRQLFLDFTNATAGYTVFGHSTVVEGINRLQEEGNISQILIPVGNLEEIKAESSWAINFGFDMDPVDNLRLRINLFRNMVNDLIETAPVARKTNGQSVFTYFNVDEVVTQGLEAELRWKLGSHLNASFGYQLLDARRKVERERNVQNEEGEVVTRTDVSFRPMFNRSIHSGNVKLFYQSDNGWGANIRGMLRGRYGLFDTNGNDYVDSGEYETGYTVWNLAVSRSIGDYLTIQVGVDNLFSYTNVNQPYLAGRLWYTQLSINF